MYVISSELNKEILFQGDVVEDFPFFIFDEKSLTKQKMMDPLPEERLVEIKMKLNRVMILSQTCDIQRRENIIIAPVYPIKMYEESKILKSGDVNLIRKRRIGYWFYLPELKGILDEAIVDLQTIHYIPSSIINKCKEKKIITLSHWGRHHLAWSLANYFGRPIEDKDT